MVKGKIKFNHQLWRQLGLFTAYVLTLLMSPFYIYQKIGENDSARFTLVDQEVYPENLAQLGRNEAWLDTDLARRGMRRAEVLAYLGNKESCVVIQKKTAQNGRSEKPESTGGF